MEEFEFACTKQSHRRVGPASRLMFVLHVTAAYHPLRPALGRCDFEQRQRMGRMFNELNFWHLNTEAFGGDY